MTHRRPPDRGTFWSIFLIALLGLTILAAWLNPPGDYDTDFKNVAVIKKSTVTVTDESYGPDPAQRVTVRRDVTRDSIPTKTVIFIHGGGWTAGGRGSLEPEATEWAKTGWVSINVSYRLAVNPNDGKLILADVLAVLAKYRAKPYVDPSKIVVYGESAGGHLAEYVGSYKGSQIAAYVAISPVSSISRAITAGQADGAPANVAALGTKAALFFGYSPGTTDSHRYYDRVQAAFYGYSTNEWVDPGIHAKVSCAALGDRCTAHEYAGTAHAGALIDAHPELAVDARHWAGQQINN